MSILLENSQKLKLNEKEWYLNQEMKENKYYDIMEEPKVDIKEKDFLENAEKEKKELEECYREALRQTNERKKNEKYIKWEN